MHHGYRMVAREANDRFRNWSKVGRSRSEGPLVLMYVQLRELPGNDSYGPFAPIAVDPLEVWNVRRPDMNRLHHSLLRRRSAFGRAQLDSFASFGRRLWADRHGPGTAGVRRRQAAPQRSCEPVAHDCQTAEFGCQRWSPTAEPGLGAGL